MPSPSVSLLRTQTDVRLVALAAGGHERAFEAIVERYRRPLLRHARRYLPEARAEDALQQALLAAWTGLRRGDDVRELRPWLHRIVHNTALNALRVPGYEYDELRETLEGSGGPAELAERRAVVRGTLAGLAALPDRQRDALLRIAVDGRSQDEVAEQLGLSQGAVRQLVHRARTALRAAATAVMPLPLAAWLATSGAARGDIAARIGELAAGAGGSATVAKAGAVALLAGGAVAGPAVVHDVNDQRAATVAAATAGPRAGAERADDAPPPVVPPSPGASNPGADSAPGGGPGDRGRSSGREGSDDDARAGRDDGSGSPREGRRDGDDGDDDAPEQRSGSGDGDAPEQRSGSGDVGDTGDLDASGGDGGEESSGTGESGESAGGDDGAPSPSPDADRGDSWESGSDGSSGED